MSAERLLTGFLAGALLLVFSAAPAAAAERMARFKVAGLSAEKDEAAVGAALEGIAGVSDYTIDLGEGSAVVAFDDGETSLDAVREAIEKSAYRVEEASYLCQ